MMKILRFNNNSIEKYLSMLKSRLRLQKLGGLTH